MSSLIFPELRIYKEKYPEKLNRKRQCLGSDVEDLNYVVSEEKTENH